MTLKIDIRADGKQAQRELKAVSKDVRKLGVATTAATKVSGRAVAGLAAGFGTVGLAAAAAAGRAAVELGRMAVEVSEVGDRTAKMARSLAISTDSLQELSFAAERSGVSQKGMANGLKLLSKNMAEAQAGSARFVETFDALGVEITEANGTLRPVEAVFRDLTDVLGAMGETTEATAVRAQLLGRSGNEMASLMMDGAAGLDAYASELERLGGLMSQDLLDSSEAFQDALTDLKVASQGTRNEISAGLIPDMQAAVELMTGLTVSTQGAAGAFGRNLIPMLRNTAVSLTSALPVLGSVVTAFEALRRTGTQMANEGGGEDLFPLPDPAEMANVLKAEEARLRLADLQAKKDRERAAQERRQANERAARDAESARRDAIKLAASDALLSAKVSQARQLAATQDEADRFRIAQATKLTAALIQIERDLTLGVVGEQQARLMKELEFQQVAADARAFEQDQARAWNDEQRTLMEQMDAEREANAQRRMDFEGQVANSVVGMAQGLGDAIIAIDRRTTKNKAKSAKREFAIQQASALAQAGVSTALSIANAAATVPFIPAGLAAAVAAGVLGAAQVATIAATPPPSVIADAGLSPEMAQRMASTHTTAIIRRDEAVIDPQGTRELSMMLGIQRRQMEMDAFDRRGGTVNIGVAATPETLRESARIDAGSQARLNTPTSASLRV